MNYQSYEIPEAIFGLERVARGYYGDGLEVRQYAERVLLRSLLLWGDDGGAVDLAYLMAVDGRLVQEQYSALAQRCLSGKMLDLLTRADLAPTFGGSSPKHEAELARLNLLSARGLVELGEFDQARALFQQYAPQVPEQPDFVAQCMAWLEGRTEEATSTPVGRSCDCDIEPSRWRAGCACAQGELPRPCGNDLGRPPIGASHNCEYPLRTPAKPAAAQTQPCVCDATGSRCTREVVVQGLDDDVPSTSTVPCDPETDGP